MASETVPIPEPTGLPILGNITAIDSEFPLGSLLSLSDQYGEIYRLRFPGRTVVVVSTRALVNETCNEKRFKKSVNSTLQAIRRGVHDGLFTAMEGEENWGIAHRVLMPAFGPLSIRNMFDEMHDIASQLTLKWARYGPNSRIMVTDDFTRLTLDTLALCSMGFRFNSFYSPAMHPFIDAMAGFLVEAGNMPRRPPLPSLFYRSQDAKFAADIDILRNTAKEVLVSRKADGESTRNDLLDAMLRGVDPKTGRKMSDESIMDNLITFLIAGHETTSGLLSFVFQELMKHPECCQKAQREVDQVVGKGTIRVEHLSKLPYINGVLRETLRVNSTIPSFTVEPHEDTVIGGKYFIKKGEVVVNLLAKSHLDPLVWGSDADEFKPERMLDAEFERINREFPNAWKPFGNGMRACIGRPFAWQEALLVMAMLLQNFNFVPDPSSGSGVKQTLTIKPKDMYMRAILRDGLTPTTLERRLAGIPEPSSTTDATHGVVDSSSKGSAKDGNGGKGRLPMTVLFGSNSGTCEALARQIAGDAVRHGFRVVTVDCLDTAKDNIPKGQPVVIVTGSYEGQPPDNAGHFVAWMESLEKDKQAFKDVSYAVFGCGHKDWVQTFHRIPKLVDDTFQDLGATRLAEIGLADVSGGEVFTNFETWEDEILWPALTARYSPGATTAGAIAGGADAQDSGEKGGLKVRVSSPRVSTLRQDLHDATVVSARTLTECGGYDQEKRHIEIKLPEGVSYSAGDYLAILPVNPRETVQRAMRRFHLAADAHLTIETEGPTTLPVDTSVPASELLGSYVELSQPATKRNLSTLAEHTGKDNAAKDALTNLADEVYTEEVVAKRISVVDLLDRFPSINLPIGTFLSMMPPMRVRQYSISSSPLWKPDHVTLTFTVLNKPALSGQGHRHVGVASTYLSSLQEGDTLHVSVRPSHTAFSLPSDPERTPLLCISAGTGLAPFRGFVQERAAMISAGRILAPALLYFGCRYPDKDDLYREEFDEWERLGAVEMRRAYSRKPEESLGCKHVQHRLWLEREEIADAWRQGAKVFVCGSRGVAEGAMDVGIKIKVESAKSKGEDLDQAEARKWLENMRNVRYATDVFD